MEKKDERLAKLVRFLNYSVKLKSSLDSRVELASEPSLSHSCPEMHVVTEMSGNYVDQMPWESMGR